MGSAGRGARKDSSPLAPRCRKRRLKHGGKLRSRVSPARSALVDSSLQKGVRIGSTGASHVEEEGRYPASVCAEGCHAARNLRCVAQAVHGRRLAKVYGDRADGPGGASSHGARSHPSRRNAQEEKAMTLPSSAKWGFSLSARTLGGDSGSAPATPTSGFARRSG